MPLIDHLRERNRVVKMARPGRRMPPVASSARPGTSSSARVLDRDPAPGCRWESISWSERPLDAFYLRVSRAGRRVIVSSPIWLYQIWAFVAPDLHARESGGVHLPRRRSLFGIGITLRCLSLGRSVHYLLRPDAGRRAEPDPGRPVPELQMAMMLAFGLAFGCRCSSS
jgi:hypothetical protein